MSGRVIFAACVIVTASMVAGAGAGFAVLAGVLLFDTLERVFA